MEQCRCPSLSCSSRPQSIILDEDVPPKPVSFPLCPDQQWVNNIGHLRPCSPSYLSLRRDVQRNEDLQQPSMDVVSAPATHKVPTFSDSILSYPNMVYANSCP